MTKTFFNQIINKTHLIKRIYTTAGIITVEDFFKDRKGEDIGRGNFKIHVDGENLVVAWTERNLTGADENRQPIYSSQEKQLVINRKDIKTVEWKKS